MAACGAGRAFGVMALPDLNPLPFTSSPRRVVDGFTHGTPGAGAGNGSRDVARQSAKCGSRPAIGIGYRRHIDAWTRANLARFDVLEITLDHCLTANEAARAAIFDLVGQIPLTAHGIGLSIGTDAPLDLAYVDRMAALLDRLKAPAYSEHLAFTRVPGR